MSSGSSFRKCVSCESEYGTNCIRCNNSICLTCRYSSNTTLSSNSMRCENSSNNTQNNTGDNSSCSRADGIECNSSVCANHIYQNGACVKNYSGNCTSGQNYVQYSPTYGWCSTCAYLREANCSTFCPDYVYISSYSGWMKCRSC